MDLRIHESVTKRSVSEIPVRFLTTALRYLKITFLLVHMVHVLLSEGVEHLVIHCVESQFVVSISCE
jgi:hypothetical protein